MYIHIYVKALLNHSAIPCCVRMFAVFVSSLSLVVKVTNILSDLFFASFCLKEENVLHDKTLDLLFTLCVTED